jgi:hypothetical protein
VLGRSHRRSRRWPPASAGHAVDHPKPHQSMGLIPGMGLLATTTARELRWNETRVTTCGYGGGGRFDTLRMAAVPSPLIRSSTSLFRRYHNAFGRVHILFGCSASPWPISSAGFELRPKLLVHGSRTSLGSCLFHGGSDRFNLSLPDLSWPRSTARHTHPTRMMACSGFPGWLKRRTSCTREAMA